MPTDLVPATLTPEEQAEFDRMSPPAPAAPQGQSVLHALSAPELAELAVKDKDNFDLVSEFRQNQDTWSDPAIVQKVADAHNLLKQRGFKFADLPGPGKIAKQVFDVGRGLLKQGWNYANAAVNAGVGVFSDSGTEDELLKDAQQRVAENFSGTEQAVTGLGNMVEKGVKKVVSKLPGTQTPADFTPEQKVKDLWDAVGKGDVEQDISKGHGAFMNAVGGEVISDLEKEGKGVRPEEVEKLAPGDPLSFWAFGKAMQAGGKVVSAATPKVVSGALNRAGQAITDNAAKVGGAVIDKAGELTQTGAKATEIGAKYGLPVAGAVYGATKAGPVGVLPGIAGGQVAARTVGKVAQTVGKVGAKVENIGEQISGAKPMVSPYAQLGKDVIESAPGVAAEVGKGAVADLGVAAVTAENPHDTEGVGLGTAIGALHGAGKTFKHAVSGQIIAPRSYGSNTPVPSSPNYPQFAAMHSQALQTAAPGVSQRVNAIRQFAKGAAPGTEVFLAPDAPTLQTALESTGLSPEKAKSWADQDGFFSLDLPDKSGTPRRVIIAKNVEAAPHEAYHAVQDVLGETANRQIDEIVKKAYGDQWEQEGARYAKRLDESSDPAKWRDTVLDWSGLGRSDAVEKLYTDVSNEVRTSTGAEPDPAFVKDRVRAEWNKRVADATSRNPSATPAEIEAGVWRDILSPEEQKAAADRYIARELAAENFDMVFKHGPEGKSLPEQLARIAAQLSMAMGGEPLSDRRSAIGNIEPKLKVTKAVKESIPLPETKVAPKPEVATSKPSVSVPGTDTDRESAAKDAKDLAEGADSAIPAGKTSSPKEILGTVAEAIAQQAGVKINYHSAPGEPAAATSSNRETRRAIIEAFRDMPKESRPLWEKNFFPERVVKTAKGYQLMGWAPEVFAANAHKLAQVLAEVNPKLSPYEIGPDLHTFTKAGWEALYEDAQRFTKNHMAGRTGAGEPLVVPKGVSEKGAYAPQIKPGAEPLDQNRADFINLLFNFRLPDTARVQKGKLPLNIVGQEVSEATQPGRTSIPVRPRGTYAGKEADALGIAGRDIKEVNPLRQQIEAEAAAKGKALPEMIEAIQRLNVENINDVQLAPEQPQFRGNTLTLSAGFQPPSAEARAEGKEYIEAPAVKMPNGQIYKGAQYHGDAIQKAMEAGHYDFDEAKDGFVTNTGRFLDREEAYQLATSSGQMKAEDFAKRGAGKTRKLESTIFREVRQFQPKTVADHMKSLDNDETWDKVRNWPKGKFGGGLTGWAFERGAEAKTAEDVAALKSANESYSDLARAAIKEHNFDKAGEYQGKAQAAHEAYQAATGTNLKGELQGADFIKKYFDKNYEPPVPDPAYLKSQENSSARGIDKGPDSSDNTPMIQAQPKASDEVSKVADDYMTSSGREYKPSREYKPVNDALMMKIADHYEAAKSDSSAKEVQKSYKALADETLAQYRSIVNAGYTIEPYSGEGEPYKSSADMVKDISDNQHLFYLPTKSAGELDKSNPMMQPSGVGDAPVNDIFRAVHDFFGHAKEGYQFGPRGEFNAWQAHSEMYSPEAQGALAAETLAQNSWVNFGKHLRNDKGAVPVKGETGYVAPTDRPFAAQKNIVIPSDLISEAKGAKFQPKKDEWKMPEKAPSGFKKAWITPDGHPVQLGGQFHHEYLAQNPELGIKVTDAPSMTEDARVDALKQGFVRINYMHNTGTMTIEGRAKDWPKQRENVRKFVEENISDIDNINLVLLDPKADDEVDSNSVRLFNYDDADKISHIPLLEESEATARKAAPVAEATTLRPDKSYNESDNYFKAQAQPKKDKEASLPGFEKMDALSSQDISNMTKDELKAHFPEAIVPNKRNDSIPSDIVGSPLYKEAGSEPEAIKAFADKMVEFANSWEDHPVYKAGKQWYSEFSPLLKETFGKDAPLMAELLAATSPQTSVETNFAYAHDALQSIKSGRFDKIISKFEQGLSMLEDEKWLSWYNKELKAGNIPEPPANPTEAAFLEAWINKHDLKPRQSNGKLYGQHSLPVLQVFARRWLDLNRGPKTRNFVANLLGDGHEATIDLWADRTMRRLGYADHKERWRILPNNKSGVSDADFHFAQKVYRAAAEQLKMNPDDLQGALWFAEKQLWADNGWGRLDLGDFRKEMEKVPMLRKGYEQRLSLTKAKAKADKAEQIDLMDVKPRRIAQ